MSVNLSFRLPDNFIDQYKDREVDWGYKDAGGNSVAEITFLRTYSRLKSDGTKERWWEVCRRVIEGTFSIQKDHCKASRLPWNDRKAQATAQDAFDRLFNFKWTPPGRGLWMMGTPLVNEQKNSAALQNCSFVSTADMTKYDPSLPFCFMMEASMLGVGVGFDTKGADKDFKIYQPKYTDKVFVIEDSREGWVESLKITLNAYLIENHELPLFDYSQIRPAGTIIKTFGGVAAGSEPLERLHSTLNKILGESVGKKLNSRLIADIGNLIGVCVVSGNVRRSAELLMGSIDDLEFLQLKDYTTEVGSSRGEWSWMSNNSVEVKVGDDLSKIIPGIAQNGEPGVIWMDITRQYGRLADAPNNKDWRAAGYNPSLVAGTRVFTTEGVKDIESLEGQEFQIRNLNGKTSDAICWQSGIDEVVYKLNLKGGHSYRATKEHKWPVWNGFEWIKKATTELSAGDKLPNLLEGVMYPDGEKGTYDEGFLIGWNLGDGWQTEREDGLQIGFIVSDNDRAHGIDLKLESVLKSLGCGATLTDKDEINVNNLSVRTLFKEYGVKHKTEGLPESIWDANYSDEYRKGVIDGIFSADASIDSGRITLTQASKKMLDDVSSLLGFFGVKTYFSKLEMWGSKAFPDKELYKYNDRLFVRNTLRIGEYNNLKRFSDIFNLSHKAKQNKIDAYLLRTKTNHKATNWFVEVESVQEDGTADVWDITVFDDTHAFQLDHCVTGNCAEQSLESMECCTLVETFLNRHNSLEDYKKTLKVAYLYAKTVTLLPTHWPQTNAIMQRNRRIGTSMSGIANFADRRGLPVLRDWMDKGYSEIQRLDNVYSEWLCVRESIKTTTVKPSGTVSILAGESPGVHWSPGGEYFNRAIRFGKDDPMLAKFKMAGYKIEDAESDQNTAVVYFPIRSLAKRSEHDVTLFEKAALAATAQRWWSDNSVSVTLSFDPDEESEHVGSVLGMYEGQLKTVSFLPMLKEGAYAQMPYTCITEKEFKQAEFRLWPVDLTSIYEGGSEDAEGEQFCTTDACLMKAEV